MANNGAKLIWECFWPAFIQFLNFPLLAVASAVFNGFNCQKDGCFSLANGAKLIWEFFWPTVSS